MDENRDQFLLHKNTPVIPSAPGALEGFIAKTSFLISSLETSLVESSFILLVTLQQKKEVKAQYLLIIPSVLVKFLIKKNKNPKFHNFRCDLVNSSTKIMITLINPFKII